MSVSPRVIELDQAINNQRKLIPIFSLNKSIQQEFDINSEKDNIENHFSLVQKDNYHGGRKMMNQKHSTQVLISKNEYTLKGSSNDLHSSVEKQSILDGTYNENKSINENQKTFFGLNKKDELKELLSPLNLSATNKMAMTHFEHFKHKDQS